MCSLSPFSSHGLKLMIPTYHRFPLSTHDSLCAYNVNSTTSVHSESMSVDWHCNEASQQPSCKCDV